jgi:hypothetical protein
LTTIHCYPGGSALSVFDDGSGPALYAGGCCATNSANAEYLARWHGPCWTAVPERSTALAY